MNERIRELAEQAANKIADLFKHGFFDQRMVDDLTKIIQTKIDRAKTDERTQCAKDYLEDCARAVEAARLEEREACAKLCDEFAKFFGEKGEYATHELHRREWETLVGCAKAIRGRTE